MSEYRVFVSVGGTANNTQEQFVKAIEDRLRSEGMIPKTVGRNTFSADAPLKQVENLMSECCGSVVIALERTYFQKGIDKRGGDNEKVLKDVKLPTPWNQIEAAMSYTRQLPVMMIVEDGLKPEGLLESGYDWYVQYVQPNRDALNTMEFNGVLTDWKSKVVKTAEELNGPVRISALGNPEEMTIGQIIGALKPAQLWSLLATFAAIVAGAFALGANLIGG